VQIEILYCGVCHSDIHQARNERSNSIYPVVPEHEFVGRVTQVGSAVKVFKVGDLASVSCMVDSCDHCSECSENQEQFCDSTVFTYSSPDKHTNKPTYGGYPDSIELDQKFVLHISENLDLVAAAPLLCAGINTYSPLCH